MSSTIFQVLPLETRRIIKFQLDKGGSYNSPCVSTCVNLFSCISIKVFSMVDIIK